MVILIKLYVITALANHIALLDLFVCCLAPLSMSTKPLAY